MCLLTVFPAGQQVTQQHVDWLEEGCWRNSDGFGFAVAGPNHIATGHGMRALDVIDEFRSIRQYYPDGAAMFHSRMATAGTVNTDNTHPFEVGGDRRTVLAHNGVLPMILQPEQGDPRSDTRIMAEDWLPKVWTRAESDWRLDRPALDAPAWRRRFRQFLAGDKVAFITVDPAFRKRLYIVNADKGHWAQGVWWSNSSYKPYVWKPTGATGTGSYWSKTDWYVSSNKAGQQLLWIKNDQGVWTSSVVDDAPSVSTVKCPSCTTTASLDPVTLICQWCNVCSLCDNWCPLGDRCTACDPVVTLGPVAQAKADAAASALKSVEDMTEDEWDAYLADRMYGGTPRAIEA